MHGVGDEERLRETVNIEVVVIAVAGAPIRFVATLTTTATV